MQLSDQAISVLLPVFHREKSLTNIAFLRRALESIHDQKISVPYEILLVDDGSPDPVFEQANLLGAAAKDVRWIRLDRNMGLVNALNRGICAANYGFIARLDADDSWLPTKIEKQLRLFEADPDLTITATGMRLVRNDDTVIDDLIRPGDWNGILKFFVDGGCPFPHGSVVARTEVYRLLGGYPHSGRFSHCEDYTLWGTWLRFFKPAMVEECLYNYTVSDSSVSAQYGAQQATASQVVNRTFARGNLAGRLPMALQKLSEMLNLSLFNAGRLAYMLWHFGPAVLLPKSTAEVLSVILFDREFVLYERDMPVHKWNEMLGVQCSAELVQQEMWQGRYSPA